jgi:hypothetical protein
LRRHIQLASALLRPTIDAAENAWRASHYDLLIGMGDPDAIRAINPYVRIFEYALIRFHNFDVPGTKTASAWALAHGYDPEDFYLHYKEDTVIPTWEGRVIVPGFPAGMVPGWNPGGGGNPASATTRAQSRVVGYYYGVSTPAYFGNIAHPGYKQFTAERIAGVIDGTWYFNTPFASGPMDGIMCDEAIWYAIYKEGFLDHSVEYYGIPINENHPYAVAYEQFYPYLSESLLAQLGPDRGRDAKLRSRSLSQLQQSIGHQHPVLDSVGMGRSVGPVQRALDAHHRQQPRHHIQLGL